MACTNSFLIVRCYYSHWFIVGAVCLTAQYFYRTTLIEVTVLGLTSVLFSLFAHLHRAGRGKALYNRLTPAPMYVALTELIFIIVRLEMYKTFIFIFNHLVNFEYFYNFIFINSNFNEFSNQFAPIRPVRVSNIILVIMGRLYNL